MPVNLNGNELPAHILSQQARHFQGRRAGARLSCRRLWKQPLDSVCCAPNPFWKPAEIPGLLRVKKGGRETYWLGRVWVGWGTRKGNQNFMLYIVFPHSLFRSSLKGVVGAKYGMFQYHHFSFQMSGTRLRGEVTFWKPHNPTEVDSLDSRASVLPRPGKRWEVVSPRSG